MSGLKINPGLVMMQHKSHMVSQMLGGGSGVSSLSGIMGGTAREQAKKIMEDYDKDAAEANGTDNAEGAEYASIEGKKNEPKTNGDVPTQKSKSATYNTDKVDAEIKRLREQKKQFEKQLQTASDPHQAMMLQKQISRLEKELQQKDNDAYRREHAEKSE